MSFSFSIALDTLQQVPLSTLTFSTLGTLVTATLGTSYNLPSAPLRHSACDVFTSLNDSASAFGTSASFGACDVFTSPQ
ncbi:unnamed protein product [Prunus armeniaca]